MTSLSGRTTRMEAVVLEEPWSRSRRPAADYRRLAPTLLAALLAALYVVVSPPSLDLAAHLLRAKLFSAQGFGIWNNWWYAGHDIPGYSVLFPAAAAALTPQLAAAIAATASATAFEPLARHHFGARAWLGATWFGAATATNLFTGRLTFAFGLLPAVACALALQRRRPWLAAALAVVTALASPVAALFAALGGAAFAVGAAVPTRSVRGAIPGLGVVAGALVPVGALALAFPEGGTEPFAFSALWPVVLIALLAIPALPSGDWTLRAGVGLYALGCVAAYALPSPVGGNAARLGSLAAGPLAALLWWRRRDLLLLAVSLPLLYIQWQAPVRDVRNAANVSSASGAYYQPLLSFLSRQPDPPFRVEIPFTSFHWEAYQVAPRFPLARGWERQLDIKYNGLFYDGTLTAATYDAWLHQLAVRFVAVPDAPLDYSAIREKALIDSGLPYLRLVLRTPHWRVYAVDDPTPIVTGTAVLRGLGPSSVALQSIRPGATLVRVRFTPYWALARGSGCVAREGAFTRLELREMGPVRLVIRFSLTRIGASSPRCT